MSNAERLIEQVIEGKSPSEALNDLNEDDSSAFLKRVEKVFPFDKKSQGHNIWRLGYHRTENPFNDKGVFQTSYNVKKAVDLLSNLPHANFSGSSMGGGKLSKYGNYNIVVEKNPGGKGSIIRLANKNA